LAKKKKKNFEGEERLTFFGAYIKRERVTSEGGKSYLVAKTVSVHKTLAEARPGEGATKESLQVREAPPVIYKGKISAYGVCGNTSYSSEGGKPRTSLSKQKRGVLLKDRKT